MERKKRKRRGNYKRGRPPLGPLHYAAIEILANGRGRNTYEDVAREVGVCRRTLYRWLQRKDFYRALQIAIQRKIRERYGPMRHDYRNIDDMTFIFQANGFNVG